MRLLYLLAFSLLVGIGIYLVGNQYKWIGLIAIILGGICLLSTIFSHRHTLLKLIVSCSVLFVVLAFIGVQPVSAIKDFTSTIKEWGTNVISQGSTESPSHQEIKNSPAPTYAKHSHTGYVKGGSTGNNQTTIIFQDGFVVQTVGSMRIELLPAIGQKVKVVYIYSQKSKGNVFISITDVR